MNNSLFNTTLNHPFIFAGYTDNYFEGKWVDIYSYEVQMIKRNNLNKIPGIFK